MLRRAARATLRRAAVTGSRSCESDAAQLPLHFLFRLPPLSPALQSARILAWRAAVGTRLQPGDALCDVTTRSLLDASAGDDAASHETALVIELHEDAVLARILVPAGQARCSRGRTHVCVCRSLTHCRPQEVSVDTPLALLCEEDEARAALEAVSAYPPEVRDCCMAARAQ